MYLNGTECTVVAANQGWEPGSAAFYLGANQLGQTASRWGGEMASLGIWNKVLSADERAAFYNSGTNLRYADL